VPPWVLLAGIATIAGLDLIALSGGALTIPALVAIFALLVAGIHRLESARLPRVETADWPEESTPMVWPLDYAIAGAIGAGNFALSFIGYWRPDGASCWTLGRLSHCGIFDELYFARAGEEYLLNLRIYENTHPPLSKLLVTLSMLLFGGMPGGDNPHGWRFLDVVFGALAVVVLYAFAKRVTGSTLFASIAAILLSLDGMHFVQSRIATPEGFAVVFATFATYAFYRFVMEVQAGGASRLWLVLFSIALGCLVSTKWYGVMGFGVSFVVLAGLYLRRPHSFRLARTLAAIVCVSAAVYTFSWVPDLVRNSPDPNEIHSFGDVLNRQKQMFDYHDTLRATHPYSSKWWEWPLDDVPVAYFYDDRRTNKQDPNGCCVLEITSLPNPVVLWFGLFSVPFVGWLAIARRNIGCSLIVLTYLMQWLPWMGSPRITFAYHFYDDIPLICLCNAIALQNVRRLSGLVSAAYVALAGIAFVFFYPILSAHAVTWNAWHARMWLPTWIIGPG
jgi:dolichyl-phosphate-mannose--protein O-mannosyl transferase